MSPEQISPAQILIVDDTPDNLRLLAKILQKQGYTVRKALGGEMAIQSAMISPPDLILLDIRMPGVDGYEVCDRLKQCDRTIQIPIIFISALGDSQSQVKAFQLGGVDYITKPFQESEAIARIENQLRIQALRRELTDRNHQLQALTDELSRSNQDLEQFAAMVSHDLQQPLQSILGFTKLLQYQDYPSRSPTAQKYLNHIEESSQRMQTLIQDALDYARLGQHIAEPEAVDCNQAVHQALHHLQAALSTQQFTINFGDLPTILGYPLQIVRLFQNLFSNAIKFAAKDRDHCLTIQAHFTRFPLSASNPETIPQASNSETKLQLQNEPERHDFANLEAHLSAHLDPNRPPPPIACCGEHPCREQPPDPKLPCMEQWLFSVHDNGIGIAPVECDRIFRLFARSESVTHYPGTGIGLAICKKIVDLHGGYIWVRSQLGIGTTFYFTLPPSPSSPSTSSPSTSPSGEKP
jgi:signal transduction histidine kinase